MSRPSIRFRRKARYSGRRGARPGPDRRVYTQARAGVYTFRGSRSVYTCSGLSDLDRARRPLGRFSTLPLPLGESRSAVRGDPAARSFPETRPIPACGLKNAQKSLLRVSAVLTRRRPGSSRHGPSCGLPTNRPSGGELSRIFRAPSMNSRPARPSGPTSSPGTSSGLRPTTTLDSPQRGESRTVRPARLGVLIGSPT